MNFLHCFLLVASLIQLHYFVTLESAVWRSVANAVLTCGGTSSSANSLDQCNQTCLSAGSGCFSYSYASDSSTCKIYSTRFGFGNCQLQINNDYDYYEKPVGIDDDYGNVLLKSQAVNGNNSFLSRYRQGIPGSVSTGDGDTSISISGVTSAEDCAKYCTRRRGLIDETTGARCDSFNYQPSTETCQLTSVTVDSTHDINLGNPSWYYYDRLKGDGCWITQSDCRQLDNYDYVGNFNTTSIGFDDIDYEYQCIDLASYFHETVCNNFANVTTVAVWAGNGEAVYDSWNSWDDTTGCVINFGSAACLGPTKTGSRFSGKFRDSIGEDQYAAWLNADYCFDRASTWYTYCNFENSEQQINVSFPDTGAYMIYPVTECECDDKGIKIDIATQRSFCRRNNLTIGTYCWRPNQQDYWSASDILCDDTTTCSSYNAASQNQSQTHCYLLDFYCRSSLVQTTEYYYHVPCPEANLTSSKVCNYDEATCLANAQAYHTTCGNSDSATSEQIQVFYQPTGAMSVYPPFSEPASTTLIDGIDNDASYTVYNTSTISLISLSDGRWMAFTALRSAIVRQITVFWYSSQSSTLTLTFYEGTGTTGNTKLASTTSTFPASNNSNGDYIQFPIDSVYVTSGTVYTWQLTSADSNNEAGYVGYIPGDLYVNGEGDLSWDYIFVEWIEGSATGSETLFAATTTGGSSRPWFEIWFIIGLILFLLFALFLLYLHYQRKKNEKKAMEEERKMQAEAKKRARLQMQAKKGNNENDDNYVALSGDSPKGSANSGNKHANASSIIEEDPNINAKSVGRTDKDDEEDDEENENEDENENETN